MPFHCVEVIDEEEKQFGIWSERLEAFIISLKYNDNGNHVNRVVEQIKPFAFGNKDTYFAYYYNMSIEKRDASQSKRKRSIVGHQDGWKIYSHFDEMMRLGIHRSIAWRVSRVNDSYELSYISKSTRCSYSYIRQRTVWCEKFQKARPYPSLCVAIGVSKRSTKRVLRLCLRRKLKVKM